LPQNQQVNKLLYNSQTNTGWQFHGVLLAAGYAGRSQRLPNNYMKQENMNINNRFAYIIFTISLIWLFSQHCAACTTFLLARDGNYMVGKNHDWMVDDGLIIINKRGMLKTAGYGKKVKGQPAVWTSKYGSVTFNQYGRELPSGGMNETGLVVEEMTLVSTRYSEPDSRPAIIALQWIQYQLDNFSTVEEVIASDSMVRIVPGMGAGLHYFCTDNKGDSVIIEFLKGKLVYHTKDTLRFNVLTNSTYKDSVSFFESHENGDNYPMPIGNASSARFIRAASMVEKYNSESSIPMIDYAFDILSNVSQGLPTKWSIVYDLKNFRIYFQTYGNPKRRFFDFHSFELSCATPVKLLDINESLKGDVTNYFKDYTRQMNYNLIRNAFKKTTVFNDMPEQALKRLARYPESNLCTTP